MNIQLSAEMITTLLTALGGILTGIFALSKYLQEQAHNREQRQAQLQQDAFRLRWDQARMAKKINDEMYNDPDVDIASRILDADDEKVTIKTADASYDISLDDVIAALQFRKSSRTANDTTLTSAEIAKRTQIRDSFDVLFYYLSMMEHHIANGLIRFDDIQYPTAYYVDILGSRRTLAIAVRDYVVYYRLGKSLMFLNRFDQWYRRSDMDSPHQKAVSIS